MAGQPDERTTLPQVGQNLCGKYALVRELGRGGFGVVFEGVHLRLRRRVAIKLLMPRMPDVARMVARFDREARHAAQLQSPYAVRILDVDTTPEGLPYLVMEYLDGRPLDEELRKRGPLPVAEAVGYALEACHALAEAHALGIVHRDIKPANLFLARVDAQTTLKVLDFGISKNSSEPEVGLTQSQVAIGTPLYMSPEQVRSSKHVDHRTDIWSLGVVIFEMLSGQTPFAGDTPTAAAAAITADPVPSLDALRPGLPPALLDAIERALTKDRDQRFASVVDLADALRPHAGRPFPSLPGADPPGSGNTTLDPRQPPATEATPRVSVRPQNAPTASGLDATAPHELATDAPGARPGAPAPRAHSASAETAAAPSLQNPSLQALSSSTPPPPASPPTSKGPLALFALMPVTVVAFAAVALASAAVGWALARVSAPRGAPSSPAAQAQPSAPQAATAAPASAPPPAAPSAPPPATASASAEAKAKGSPAGHARREPGKAAPEPATAAAEPRPPPAAPTQPPPQAEPQPAQAAPTQPPAQTAPTSTTAPRTLEPTK